jgi:hypothetical protein
MFGDTTWAMCATVATSLSEVRLGVARGRYFRENFAQGGVDLVQIIPELVTNADAAIAAAGRESGRIMLEIAVPDPVVLQAWAAQMRSLRSPALLSWRHELRCTDDGEGVDAAVIDGRLGALGVEPPRAGRLSPWRVSLDGSAGVFLSRVCGRRVVWRGGILGFR